MLKLKKIYNKISKQTQNKLQEIFDTFKFTSENLYNIADNKTKRRANTYIEQWKEQNLLNGYFGILAKNIYNRTRVKNNEILELLIYSAYIEEQSKLNDKELNIFKEDANYYYQQGQEEVNKTLKKKKIVSVIPDAIFLALLDMSNSKGYTWNEYLEAAIKYNADQIYRQAIIDIQQQKELYIYNDIYQNLIKRQQNLKLNINEDKISGNVDLTLIGINNKAKIEGIYSFNDKAKVKFIGINDEKQTDMCKSLDGQEFYIHDWNEFYRYSKSNDTIKKYRCFGLITGLNCPPIDDGFHWCRSYIIYLPPVEKVKIDKKYNIFSSKEEKNFENKYNINKVRMNGINKDVLNNILSNMQEVYKDFPQIKGKIKQLESIEHPSGGMNIKPDLKDNKYIMQINKKFFSDEKAVQKQYEKDLEIGFHPKGTTYKDMGIHELGHSATFEIIKTKYKDKKAISFDWNNNITAKEIVKKAFNNLGINDKITQDILRNNISNYAISNYSETIGESFADYYANKEKANIVSKEIIKVMKGMI